MTGINIFLDEETKLTKTMVSKIINKKLLVIKSLTKGLFCSTMMHSTHRQSRLEILDVFMEPQTQYVQNLLLLKQIKIGPHPTTSFSWK